MTMSMKMNSVYFYTTAVEPDYATFIDDDAANEVSLLAVIIFALILKVRRNEAQCRSFIPNLWCLFT